MSHQLLNLNDDLRRLRDEGYEIETRDGYLLVRHVPYVKGSKEVAYGTLVSKLTLTGNKTIRPDTHVVFFQGDYPCHRDGSPIEPLRHTSGRKDLGGGLFIDHSFSNKPPEGYKDYYEKITTYVRILSAPAESLDGSATALTFAAVDDGDEGGVFEYTDTNSSRAEINAISSKLKNCKVAIVGLGGTGAYVLDLVSKTPVPEIHIFDGDRFVQHNAFRSPGAPSRDELTKTPFKTDYFKGIYSRMHKVIFSHPYRIDSSNVDELSTVDFVFVCIDDGNAKKPIVERLEKSSVQFIDVGMGVEAIDGQLHGILRTTCSTPAMRGKFRTRVSFDEGVDEAYRTNIQIADLNMLNAAFAVLKWKKLLGFYDDQELEYNSTYTIDVNMLLSEDHVDHAA